MSLVRWPNCFNNLLYLTPSLTEREFTARIRKRMIHLLRGRGLTSLACAVSRGRINPGPLCKCYEPLNAVLGNNNTCRVQEEAMGRN
jgi:hypothetical protein